MTIRNLPQMKFNTPGMPRDIYSEMLEHWDPSIQARSEADGTVISIYDVIGETWDGNGVTVKRVAAALRLIGPNDVTVNINSPGGSYFDGIAIYNLLREHQQNVTINIIGMAASAASVIAMAGDDIRIAKPAEIMIHNAWAIAIGNSAAMIKTAHDLAHFDQSMGTLYSDKTGIKKAEIHQMMDAETYLNGPQAVEMGFADGFLESDQVDKTNKVKSKALASVRRLEYSLKKEGVTGEEAQAILTSVTGAQIAATPTAAPDENFDSEILAGINQLIKTLKK